MSQKKLIICNDVIKRVAKKSCVRNQNEPGDYRQFTPTSLCRRPVGDELQNPPAESDDNVSPIPSGTTELNIFRIYLPTL